MYINMSIIKVKCLSVNTFKYLADGARVTCKLFSTNPGVEEQNYDNLIAKYKDKLIYNSYLEAQNFNNIPYVRKKIVQNMIKYKQTERVSEPVPVSLQLLTSKVREYSEPGTLVRNATNIQFPLKKREDIVSETEYIGPGNKPHFVTADDRKHEVKSRLELLNKSPTDSSKWMTSYENYEDLDSFEANISAESLNFGTTNHDEPISSTPCSGCGAFLHCRDTAIPGYIPYEIFKNAKTNKELHDVICQRCHFLKSYKIALQVSVTPDDYLRVLKTITTKERVLVVLLVDLLDFPASIWPGIADLLSAGRKIMIAGNKFDLLSQDGPSFEERVKHSLKTAVNEHGFAMKDVLHVGLISAKTGYGVEDFISKMFRLWGNRGDVFIVGCTNAGKSSFFNVLLQSDYCKAQAASLIQRATTSVWPGTTLNLLKFPITRLNFNRLQARRHRLRELQLLEKQAASNRTDGLRSTRNLTKYGSLIGRVDRTFIPSVGWSATQSVQDGIDEKNVEYALSKWCFDTPGVVNPQQFTDILTTDELLLSQPKEIIRPRTFSLRPETSILIGGIGRLDYAEGSQTSTVRFTVFASNELPITICKTECASDIYDDFLRTEHFFKVPIAHEERLSVWPGLSCGGSFKVSGEHREVSCADVVLSSAGWVAITPSYQGDKCLIHGWTPEGRGVHLRTTPLLSRAVSSRGTRLRGSVAYTNNHFYINRKK